MANIDFRARNNNCKKISQLEKRLHKKNDQHFRSNEKKMKRKESETLNAFFVLEH